MDYMNPSVTKGLTNLFQDSCLRTHLFRVAEKLRTVISKILTIQWTLEK